MILVAVQSALPIMFIALWIKRRPEWTNVVIVIRDYAVQNIDYNNYIFMNYGSGEFVMASGRESRDTSCECDADIRIICSWLVFSGPQRICSYLKKHRLIFAEFIYLLLDDYDYSHFIFLNRVKLIIFIQLLPLNTLYHFRGIYRRVMFVRGGELFREELRNKNVSL